MMYNIDIHSIVYKPNIYIYKNSRDVKLRDLEIIKFDFNTFYFW